MKKGLFILFALFMLTGTAHADYLGSIIHDYGSGTGEFDPGGNDTLYSDYVLVSDQSSSRFTDSFSLGSLNYDTIDKFTLTLTFADTDNGWTSLGEAWHARPGGTLDFSNFYLGRVDGKTTLSFDIDASCDTFASMVNSGTFYYWLADEGIWNNTFELYEAALAVYGTPTPIPGAIWLLGSGLLGMLGLRKKMRQ